MRKVLAIVGMPGSGKGTITDYLEDKGFKTVHFGKMVYEEVERRGLDIVLDERNVREDMREKEGLDVLAKRASARADEHFEAGSETVILDGLYSWTENKFMMSKYGEDYIVAAVVTPKKVRWQRASDREDNVRKYTPEQVAMRDVEEIENLEKGGPIAYADYYLSNTGSPEELLAELDEFIASHNLTP